MGHSSTVFVWEATIRDLDDVQQLGDETRWIWTTKSLLSYTPVYVHVCILYISVHSYFSFEEYTFWDLAMSRALLL